MTIFSAMVLVLRHDCLRNSREGGLNDQESVNIVAMKTETHCFYVASRHVSVVDGWMDVIIIMNDPVKENFTENFL